MRLTLALPLLLLLLGSPALSQESDSSICGKNLLMLAKATESYISAEGKPPLTVNDLITHVIKRLPTCPSSGAGYAIIPTGKEYRIYCQGKHHGAEGVPPDHPSYRSGIGLEKFELSTKYARGKRVELFGHQFDLPHGYLKTLGGGQRPVQLVHEKEQSIITCQPVLPPQTGLDWPDQVAASLEAQGYQVYSLDRHGKYGFLMQARAGQQGLGLVIEREGSGQFFEVVFRGDYSQLAYGCRIISGIARSLEPVR